MIAVAEIYVIVCFNVTGVVEPEALTDHIAGNRLAPQAQWLLARKFSTATRLTANCSEIEANFQKLCGSLRIA